MRSLSKWAKQEEAQSSGRELLACPGQVGSGQWLSLQISWTGLSRVWKRR